MTLSLWAVFLRTSGIEMAAKRKISHDENVSAFDFHVTPSAYDKEHPNDSQDVDSQAVEIMTSEDLNLQVMLKEYDSNGLALAIANGEYPRNCLDNSKTQELAEMPPKTEFITTRQKPFTVPELKFIVQSVDDLCVFLQVDPNGKRSLEVTSTLQKCLQCYRELLKMPPKTEFVTSLKRPFTVPELKFIVQSVDDLCGFLQDDPNAERSSAVTSSLQKTVQCYRELLEEKKAKPPKQSTIGDFFVKKPKMSKL